MPVHVYNEPKVVLGSGLPLTDGNYRVVVTEAVEKTSKAGNPMIELKLSVTEPAAYEGRHLREFLVFGKAAWKMDQVLAAISYKAKEGQSLDIGPADFMGESAIVRVEMEPDRMDPEKKWPRVRAWLWGFKADEADLGPETPEPARVAHKVTNTSAVEPVLPADDADDDIPF